MFIVSSQAKALAVVPETAFISPSALWMEKTPLSKRRIYCSAVSGSELFVAVPTNCFVSFFTRVSNTFLDLSNTGYFS